VTDKKHLWEVKHPYYCVEGQYFTTQDRHQTIFEYDSFDEFLEECGNLDHDYNLLFRWDWTESSVRRRENGGVTVSDSKVDASEKNGTLTLFIMLQRKGYHTCAIIKVCRADEPAVIDFLKPRLEHLKSLWAPLTAASDLSV
jgi:hypothetical protein